jgi:hypothetical protein
MKDNLIKSGLATAVITGLAVSLSTAAWASVPGTCVAISKQMVIEYEIGKIGSPVPDINTCYKLRDTRPVPNSFVLAASKRCEAEGLVLDVASIQFWLINKTPYTCGQAFKCVSEACTKEEPPVLPPVEPPYVPPAPPTSPTLPSVPPGGGGPIMKTN